jgi:hypothetical protein
MSEDTSFRNAALLSALSFTSSRPDHYYASPAIQPKRASVAMIIWIKPPTSLTAVAPVPENTSNILMTTGDSICIGPELKELFSQSWAQQGEPQVLFIKRAKRTGDRWSAHVALPGTFRSIHALIPKEGRGIQKTQMIV